MEPLPTTWRSLIWLCMCPSDNALRRWQKLPHATYTTICLGALIACFGSALAYCIKFVSIDLGRSMFSFVFVVGEFSVIYIGLVAIYSMYHKIDTIFKTLSTIYNASMWMKCSKFQTENIKEIHLHFISFHPFSWKCGFISIFGTSERMWKIYLKFFIPNVIIMNQFVAPLISIIYNWLIDDNLDVMNFFRPLPLVWVIFSSNWARC